MGVNKQGSRRLQKEYAAIAKNPPPYILARPREDNLFETHFILRGPEGSPYAGGEYWGTLGFPDTYPFAPPAIKVLTATGRFQTNREICTSMSNFHPGTWNPSWSIETILTGLLSFMLDNEMTTGSIKSTDSDKRQMAAASHAWNITQPRFKTIFPEYALPVIRDLPNMAIKERNLPTQSTSTSVPPDTRQQTQSVSSHATRDTTTVNAAATGHNQHTGSAETRHNQRFSSLWWYAGICVVVSALLAKFTT